jgi:hypothetical protein
LSNAQVEHFFQQQEQELQQQIIAKEELKNIPVTDIQAVQKESNTEYQHKKEEIEIVTSETKENLKTLKNELSLEQYLLQTEEKITDTKKRLRFLKR